MRYVIHQPTQLGDAVAEFRTLRGVSQAELARRLGVHRSYLSELESGPATAALERWLTALHELGAEIVVRSIDG